METLTATEGLITKVIGPVVDVEFPSVKHVPRWWNKNRCRSSTNARC